MLDAVLRGLGVGLAPKICDTPLRYDKCMFSLAPADGRLEEFCERGGAKKGDTLDKELRAGERIGGLFGGLAKSSDLIQGPVDLCSDTTDNTGEAGSASF